MKFIPSVLQQILLLASILLIIIYFGWAGIMPVVAVQVLSNTLLSGVALVLFAKILISTTLRQEQ